VSLFLHFGQAFADLIAEVSEGIMLIFGKLNNNKAFLLNCLSGVSNALSYSIKKSSGFLPVIRNDIIV